MKLSKEEILKHSYVISINEKRLEYFYSNMEKINFSGIKHVIGQLDSNDGAKNLNNTVCNLIKYAKKNNFPFITIFEDDACPVKNFKEEFLNCINKIPDDARCISLGYTHSDSIYNKDKNIKFDNFKNCEDKIFISQKEIRRCWGSQAYIVYNTDYDRLHNLLCCYKEHNDPTKWNNCRYETDVCLYRDNNYFYVKKIPLFIQKNITNDMIHNIEGSEYSEKLLQCYNIN